MTSLEVLNRFSSPELEVREKSPESPVYRPRVNDAVREICFAIAELHRVAWVDSRGRPYRRSRIAGDSDLFLIENFEHVGHYVRRWYGWRFVPLEDGKK